MDYNVTIKNLEKQIRNAEYKVKQLDIKFKSVLKMSVKTKTPKSDILDVKIFNRTQRKRLVKQIEIYKHIIKCYKELKEV